MFHHWEITFAALALGASGAFLMARFAFAWGLVDRPNERSSHTLPTPRGGGVGILLAIPAAGGWLGIHPAVWGSALVTGLLSFFDDRLGLAPRTRFMIQAAGAGACLLFAVPLPDLPWPLRLALYAFGLVYLTGTANFFNFMDGINGIAGIAGSLAFAALSGYAWLNGLPAAEVAFNAAVAAACLGFLPFNFPLARVFMGDVGSVTLGFLFAAQAFRYAGGFVELLLLSGFLFLFYIDALTTLFIRWRAGERLSQAHRRHLYQICVNQLGLAHWPVSLAYGLAQGAISLSLFVAAPRGAVSVQLALALCLAAFCLVSRSARMRAALAAG